MNNGLAYLATFSVVIHNISFLPCCVECRAVLSRSEMSVSPSIHLSDPCIVTKQKKLVPTFLYQMKDHLS